MDRIVSFLLFALFFYIMMRFGCGSHMVHGHHRGTHGGPPEGKARDPVCGMEVEEGRGFTEVMGGRAYRFCSHDCLDKFDANPQKLAHA